MKRKKMKPYRTWQVVTLDGRPAMGAERHDTPKAKVKEWLESKHYRIARVLITEIGK